MKLPQSNTTMKVPRSLFVAGAFGLLALSNSAHAAVVVNSLFLSSKVANGTTHQVLVNQFDSSLGTLISVTVQATAFSTGGSVTFTATTAGSRTLMVGTDVSIEGPTTVPTTIMLNPSPLQSQLFTGLMATNVRTLNGTSSNDTDTSSATAGLSPYIGNGTVTFNIAGNSSTGSFGSAAGSTTDSLPNFSVDGTVTYNYEPIPEPSSALILGLAAVAGGLRRRR